MKVLELISFIPGIPAVIGSPKSGLQEFVVGSLGDIFIVITDEAQSSGLRDGLLRELRKNSEDLERQKHKADAAVLEAASVESLSTAGDRDDLDSKAGEIGEQLELEKRTIETIKTWVSIGSIMTLAWSRRVVETSNRKYLDPIPKSEEIEWLNLWANFDIATGAKLVAPDSDPPIPQPMNLRVNNFGSLALDHTGYWDNIEEVYLLLLEELGGREKSNDFWRWNPKKPAHKR